MPGLFLEPGLRLRSRHTVRTKAVRDGDQYVVNGHKTWTTLAQHADWIFCLVRTDPTAKPQSGISFVLIDMTSPGVTVRRIITIDGSHEVNDVFLEDVRVPVENLIGEENKGWTYANSCSATSVTSMAGDLGAFDPLHRAFEEDRRGRDPGG